MAYLFNQSWRTLLDFFDKNKMSRLSQQNWLQKFASTEEMFKLVKKSDLKKYPLEVSNDKKKIRVITLLDKDYPQLLQQIENPPVFIYLLGKDLNYRENLTISVIGSRHPTAYGEKVTNLIIDYFTHPDITIISGMAIGIDSIAQKRALQKNMNSIAVLGSGPDVCYPKSEYRLYQDLIEKGSIISEYPPGTQPLRYHFPMRNRIISGLSKQLIVSEAGRKSGTMFTAQSALEQGRDVYAIPGSIFMKESQGCHQLINDGAKIIMNLEDMSQISQEILHSLGQEDLLMIHLINQFRPDFDQLQKLTKYSISNILIRLGKLESLTLIEQKNGNYYLTQNGFNNIKH